MSTSLIPVFFLGGGVRIDGFHYLYLRVISHPLVDSPDVRNDQGCAGLKSKAENYIQIFRVGNKDPVT